MKRSADQGSQRLQGEALEADVEEILTICFSSDEIVPIKIGARGADILQRVCTKAGSQCGTILWETKNAKKWSNTWINKLKEDKKNQGSDVAILVSRVLPDDIDRLGLKKNIIITDYNSVVGIATILRKQIMKISTIKQSQVGKDKKIGLLYNYIISEDFFNSVEFIVQQLEGLRRGIATERNSMHRLWKKREAQIVSVAIGLYEVYGTMEGIAGAKMNELPFDSFPELPGHEEEE